MSRVRSIGSSRVLGVADHLVLLPVGGGRLVSAGYAICNSGPCSGFVVRCSKDIHAHARRQSLCRLIGSAAAVLGAIYDLSESITSSDDPRGVVRAALCGGVPFTTRSRSQLIKRKKLRLAAFGGRAGAGVKVAGAREETPMNSQLPGSRTAAVARVQRARIFCAFGPAQE